MFRDLAHRMRTISFTFRQALLFTGYINHDQTETTKNHYTAVVLTLEGVTTSLGSFPFPPG